MENYLNYSDERLINIYNKLNSDKKEVENMLEESPLAIDVYDNMIAKIKTELTNRNITY